MRDTVIFDMDGVLIDSFEGHYSSWLALAQEDNVPFTLADFSETFGTTSEDLVRRYWPGSVCSYEFVRHVVARKEDYFRRLLASEVLPMEGAFDLVQDLRSAGFMLALGTSAPRKNVEAVLDRFRWRSDFLCIVTGEDVTRGKPDPEVYSVAASRLGVAATQCVVVEDAPVGVLAGRAAGMATVAVRSPGRTRQQLLEVFPTVFVDSLSDVSPDNLRTL
jgi:beta-phosphoglucomutase